MQQLMANNDNFVHRHSYLRVCWLAIYFTAIYNHVTKMFMYESATLDSVAFLLCILRSQCYFDIIHFGSVLD